MTKTASILIIFLIFNGDLYADESDLKSKDIWAEREWGIGAGFRVSTIPFDTKDDSVGSFVPLMFFEGDRFFMRGLEGGMTLFSRKNWDLNAIGRLRFFDIPVEYQNQVQEDTVDWGFQFKYTTDWNGFLTLETMTDIDIRTHGNIRGGITLETERLEIEPYAKLMLKSGDFNNHYYGLTVENPGFGAETSLGFKGKLHVVSNFYLIGAAELTRLDKGVTDIEFVDEDYLVTGFLGIAFFNDRKKDLKAELSIKPYLRLAHGWATPSNMGDILTGNTEQDPYNNQMTSIFYGYPLTDELFTLPLELYITPGLVCHWSSEVQDTSLEYVLGIKLYYTIPLPIRFRLGAAEGLSYASKITYIEATEMEQKGYEPSHLMNYLDFSLDVNIGDLIRRDSLKGLWLGYGIHHRSSIFETASQFGRIKGGSNYNSIYLQWHF